MLKKVICAVFILCMLSAPCKVLCADNIPCVSASAAVLMNAQDNSIIFQKNADQRLPMASTTKIMTCITALENGDPDQVVSVADEAIGVEGSSLYLCKGDTATLRDLLYAVMLRSANDAASAVAYHISGSIDEFARLMNGKAAELGLVNTHFTNPHGLHDAQHYTSASDLAALTSYAMKNSEFARMVSATEYTVSLNGGECKKPVANHNRLLRTYEGAVGVKTGFTKTSGRCLVSCAQRDGVRLIAVTLNAPDDWADHRAMLDLGFSEFVSMVVLEKGQLRRQFDVAGCEAVEAVNTEEITATVRKGADITFKIEGERLLFSPVYKGDAVAQAIIFADGRELARVSLLATEDRLLYEKPSIYEKLKGLFFK